VCGTLGTCAGSAGCVPAGAKYCLSSPGVAACPAGFPVHYLLDPLGSFHDGRSCTACTCGAWQQPGCVGGADFWDGTACGGSAYGVPAGSNCFPTAGFNGMSANVALQPTGSCPPSSSVPTGAVTADQATTICCQ
jgi:hypothetical protein